MNFFVWAFHIFHYLDVCVCMYSPYRWNCFAVNQLWSQPVIKGVPPTPRDSHSCTTVGDNLYVFGGTDGMSPLKDLHILDTCELVVNL